MTIHLTHNTSLGKRAGEGFFGGDFGGARRIFARHAIDTEKIPRVGRVDFRSAQKDRARFFPVSRLSLGDSA
jgi:hypothetical protein